MFGQGTCTGQFDDGFKGTCNGHYDSALEGHCAGEFSDITTGGTCTGQFKAISVGTLEMSLSFSATTGANPKVTGTAKVEFAWSGVVRDVLGVSHTTLSASVTVSANYIRLHFRLPQIKVGPIDVTDALGRICIQLNTGRSGKPGLVECTGKNEAFAHLLDVTGNLPEVPEGHIKLDLAKLDPAFAHLSYAELTDPSHHNFDKTRLPSLEGLTLLNEVVDDVHLDLKGSHTNSLVPQSPLELH